MDDYRKIPIRTLETPRLLLRPLALSDAPRIQSLLPNPNVVRYLHAAFPWPYPANGATTFLSEIIPKIEREEEYAWALVRKGHEEEGLIGLIHLTPGCDRDSRGFWLGEPYWNQGLMREAVAAIHDFGFDELEMKEMRLNNAAPNLASHRLKESVGAEIVEIVDTDYIGGRFPGVRWRLTAEAWREHRASLS